MLTGDATDLVDVLHDVLAGGLEVGEEGDAVRDGLDVLELELDPDRVRDRDEVQDGVGGPSKGHGKDLNEDRERDHQS